MKILSGVLTLISLTASLYYFISGLTRPENMAVYRSANVPVWGIRMSAVLLGAGGMLLLFPLTYRLATSLLVMHSMFTIVCFVIAKDWRGGLVESLLLMVPVFLFRAGYPVFALEKVRALL